MDVVGLDVAMDEASTVDEFEPIENRQHDAQKFAFRKRPAPVEQGAQRAAFLETHHHVRGAVELEY